MFTNRSFKKGWIIFIVFILIMAVILAIPIMASSGESANRTETVFGYTYVFRSLIHNETSGSLGYQTTVWVTSANSVPVGYMGVKARLYNSSGALKAYTDWDYNIVQTNSFLQSGTYSTTSGFYYSCGHVKLYNGNGYTEFDSYATPYYSPSRNDNPIDRNLEIQYNEYGEVYGSELFLNEVGIQPDLILAENSQGLVGYIRNLDLNYDPVTTLEDAIAYTKTSHERIVPLYLSDGRTVIGSFEIC